MAKSDFIEEIVGKQVLVVITDGFDYQQEFLMDSAESAKNFLIKEIKTSVCPDENDSYMRYLETMGELSDSEDDIKLLNLAVRNLSNDLHVFSVSFAKILKVSKA